MKFSRIDLLTLLISLFILNSCKNQNVIDLGVNSNNQVNGTLVVDTSIIINTVPEDSVATSSLAKMPLGYFNDPSFGTSQADLITDLNLPNSGSYTLPAGTVTIDSARLVLRFADGFYGDSIESTYTVNVYQLNENFSHSTSYYSNKKWNYNSGNLLGSFKFTPHTHDSVYIKNIITGAPDTDYKVPPQVRIPINQNWVNSNFFNAGSGALGSNTIFQNSIKGLYLTIDKTKSSGKGGIMMIKADTLAIYYKAVNGAKIDTAQAKLPGSSSAIAITHTYVPAVQAALNNNSSNGTVYFQGLAGLKAKVNFQKSLQNLRNIVPAGSDILLNRAELVINPLPGSNIPFSPMPKLTMYTYDIALRPMELQDARVGTSGDPRSGGTGVFGGFYSPSRLNYHFIITAFLQDLLSGKTVKDYGTYIAPIDTTNSGSVDIAETPQVAARTIAIGTDKNSKYGISLNVIYTIIRKAK